MRGIDQQLAVDGQRGSNPQPVERRCVFQTLPRRSDTGKPLSDLDLFGEQVRYSALPSNAGRPCVPLRVTIALLYLKHAFNLSAEALVKRWSNSATFHYFSGQPLLRASPAL